jgi:hypothetical protein
MSTMKDAGEKAMALVDGQLAPADVPGLVQELARNAGLIAELQEYLALSRSRMATVYAAKAEEPVPRWLTDAVTGAAAPAGAREGSRDAVAGFGRRLLGWLRSDYRVPAWSLAAGPALAAATVVATVAGYLATSAPGRSVLAEADLTAALERTQSGRDVALATLRPVLSFNSQTGAWCRQFEVRNASRQVSHALACRGAGGQWTVVASTAPAAGGGFAPAGADARKTIDDLVTSTMQGNPLSQDEEAAAIGRRWSAR